MRSCIRLHTANYGERRKPDSSKNSRGLFLQLHIVSSADLLWDEKKSRKRKANVSSDYFAVERLISRRTSHGTVSSQFALVYDVCH